MRVGGRVWCRRVDAQRNAVLRSRFYSIVLLRRNSYVVSVACGGVCVRDRVTV